MDTQDLIRQNELFSGLLASLNPAQRAAVEHIEGPVLVVAGPGTGKTQIIAGRIGYILSTPDAQVAPQNILCLTYTDAGTIAMRKRLLQFIGPTAYRVHIHTFHSFCNEVIQYHLDYFGKNSLEPITELEQITLLHELIDGLQPSHPLRRFRGDIYFETRRLKRLFSMIKEEDYSADYLEKQIETYLADLPSREEYIYKKANPKKNIRAGDLKQDKLEEQVKRMNTLRAAIQLFPRYQEMMMAANRYDYSDMILWVIRAFRDDENLLRQYQEKYQYFLVDEFQDTNGAQNEVLQLLTAFWEVPNVFAVGDDDQCIYEFQGARLRNIRDYMDRYRGQLERIVLTENYRSTQCVLDAASRVIGQNRQRLVHLDAALSKQLTASHADRQECKTDPRVVELPNITQEEAFVVEEIERLRAAGVPGKEIAVIYHRHAQAENVIQLLEKKDIPFQSRKKINILNLPLVQNLLTLLKYLEAESLQVHSGEEYLFELMHYAFFGLEVRDIAHLAVFSAGKNKDYQWRVILASPDLLAKVRLRNPQALERLEKNLSHWIGELPNVTLQMMFEKILQESGLLAWALQQPDKHWQMQVITTFFDFIKNESIRRPRIRVSELLYNISLLEQNELAVNLHKSVLNEEGVNFVSVHSAKGLEFRHVYLMGCTSDKWEKARGPQDTYSLPDTITFESEEDTLESKRRLFYVAMTRAMEHLTISYAARKEDGKDLMASCFVAETGLPVTRREVSGTLLFEMEVLALQPAKAPVIALIEENIIRKRLENFSLSASALNSYLRCPISFYYDYVIRVPEAKSDSMAFGSAVHKALQQLFETMKANKGQFFSREELVQVFTREMYRNRDSFTEKQLANRLEHGRQVLPAYYDQYIHQFHKIVSTEYRINGVETEGVPINGSIDKIEFDGTHCNVVDYKTGKVEYALPKLKGPEEDNPLGGDYWRQLVFYKILIESQRTQNWEVVSGEIDFVEKDDKTGKFIKRKLALLPEEVKIVKEQIKTAYGRIMAQEFSTGCGRPDCHWCNFVKDHGLTKETS